MALSARTATTLISRQRVVLTLSELLESDRTDKVWYNRPIFVQAPERNWPGSVHIRDNGERTMEESEQWRGEERQRCRRDRDQRRRRRPVPRVTDPNIDHDRPLQSEPVLKTSKNLWKTWERTPRSRESELGGRGPCARCCRTAWSADELATLSHVGRLTLKIQWSIWVTDDRTNLSSGFQ